MSEIREHRNTTYSTCEIWAGTSDNRPQFFSRAACKGMTDIFFPEGRGYGVYRAARTVCNGCPVKTECRDWALETREVSDGMLGGLTPRERQTILVEQGVATPSSYRSSVTCRSGHLWTPENTLEGKRQRQCRQCMHIRYERMKRRRERD